MVNVPSRRVWSVMSNETELQSTAAEFLGTLILVFFAVGATVLSGEYIGTLGIALTFGFTLLALAYVFGPISGAHVNPAVTLGMLLAKRLDLPTAVRYWVAQLAGAIAGAALLFLLAKQVPGLRTSGSFGTNGFGDRSAVQLNLGGAFLTEVLLTCLLVYVYLCMTHKVTIAGFGGLPIGLTYAVVGLIGVPLTGAGANPARSLGPAIFAGGAALTQFWLFLVAPLLGALLAVAGHRVTHPVTGAELHRGLQPSGSTR
jgi:aquaporin Z